MSLSISESDTPATTHSIFDDAKIGNRFLTYNGLTAVYLYSKSDRHIFYVEGIKNMLAYDLQGYPMYNENTELRITKKNQTNMAFYPAHCDEQCKECEKNQCGWCIWKDQATPYYSTESFTATQTNVYYESSNIQKSS